MGKQKEIKDFKAGLRGYEAEFIQALAQVRDKRSLQKVKNLYLSRKKGILKKLLEELKALSPEKKPEAGQMLNNLKVFIQEKLKNLEEKFIASDQPDGQLDLTLPGRRQYWGAPHPALVFQEEIENIFLTMGFSIEEGPEIETDYYNFEALNFPPHHPARDEWGILHITDDLLLRPYASPVQIHVMEKRKPPIKIIIPGKVYRREIPDAIHLAMFHMVEGLVVDRGISFAHLKGIVDRFLKTLLNGRIKIRFRPSFSFFTEPSASVDIECTVCEGKDNACSVCGGNGWVKILRAGMVAPQVFKNVNIDPEKYSGFAFGMGVDRMAMFACQIPDMRILYENDLRFIRQFSLK